MYKHKIESLTTLTYKSRRIHFELQYNNITCKTNAKAN